MLTLKRRFFYDQYFTERKIIAKPLNSKFSNNKKQAILAWGIILLRQVKGHVYNNVNSAKVNAINRTKYNFIQPLSVKINSR